MGSERNIEKGEKTDTSEVHRFMITTEANDSEPRKA